MTPAQRKLLSEAVANGKPLHVRGARIQAARSLDRMGYAKLTIGGTGLPFYRHWWYQIEPTGKLPPPEFHRVAPGDYETDDGVFRLIKLDGGKTQAWNVEWTTEFEADQLYDHGNIWGYPVDGARTKKDALALFAQWWAENGHPAPGWRKS